MYKKIKMVLAFFLISAIMPSLVNAKAVSDVNYEVSDVYINASVDFLGSIHVTEAIVVNGSLNGFERSIYYKNDKLAEWNKDNMDFSSNDIYNAKGISISKISSFKIEEDSIDWPMLSTIVSEYAEKEASEEVKKGDSGVYTIEMLDNGGKVRIYNPNESGYVVYFLDYYVNQAVVLHNDVAELYWTFLPEDFDDVGNVNIQVTIPGYSTDKTFRFWAHGSLNGSIAGISDKKDDEGNNLYNGILATVQNVTMGSGVDVRMTFDKSIVSLGDQLLNKSGVDALDEIIKVETGRAESANRERRIAKSVVYVCYGLSISYLVGLIALWIYMYIKYDREYKVDFDHDYYRDFAGDYGPEIVDYLLTQNISTNAMSASILNLIYKKNIEVETDTNNKKNAILKLKSEDNVTGAEKRLLDLLFKTISKADSVSLKEIEKFSSKYTTAEKFMNAYDLWKNTALDEAKKENFFENNTIKRVMAGLYLIVGIIVSLFSLYFNFYNIYLLGASIILSIIFFIYIISFKKWTKKGREHYLKWNAFKNFLDDFGSFQDKELPEVALWEKYLVYATVLGLAKKVQKAMKVHLTNFEDGYYMNTYPNMWLLYNNNISNEITHSISKSYATSVSTINMATANSSSSSGSGFGGGFSSGGGFGGGGGSGHGF